MEIDPQKHRDADVYPLAESIPQQKLDDEAARLDALQGKPLLFRLPVYVSMGGPGFMGAALTLVCTRKTGP